MMLCEFHIPISPTPDFLRRVHYLAASIRMNSELGANEYRIVVTVGDPPPLDLLTLCPWTREHPLEWRWLPEEKFKRWHYYGTAYERYCYDFEAPVVVMLDGDVLVTGSLVETVRAVAGTNRLSAVPGYFSPFFLFPEHLAQASPAQWWQRIFDRAGLPLPAFETEHPGWPWMRAQQPPHAGLLQFSLPYPNAGVVMMSNATARGIGRHIYTDLDLVNEISRTTLSGQVALSLAIARLGLAWDPLPLRYNFQNVPWVAEAYPEEAQEIRVLHFLAPEEVHRVRDFQTEESVQAMLDRPGLHPINRFFVDHLRKVVANLHAPPAR